MLPAELYPSFRAVIGLNPESERTFDRALGLAAATAEPAKTESGSRGRYGFGIASRVRKGRRAIANHGELGIGEVGLIAPLDILLAAIQIHVQLGRVPFQSGQTLVAAQGSQRAIGIDRRIREARGAVTAYAITVQGVNPEVRMLGYGEAGVSAHAAAILGSVIGSDRRRSSAAKTGVAKRFDAGINAVAKAAEDTKDFVVAKTRLKCSFSDDVGHGVKGIIGCVGTGGSSGAGRGIPSGAASGNPAVVKSAAIARATQGKIRGIAASRKRGLGIFQ